MTTVRAGGISKFPPLPWRWCCLDCGATSNLPVLWRFVSLRHECQQWDLQESAQ